MNAGGKSPAFLVAVYHARGAALALNHAPGSWEWFTDANGAVALARCETCAAVLRVGYDADGALETRGNSQRYSCEAIRKRIASARQAVTA